MQTETTPELESGLDGRDFEFSHDDFLQVCTLIHQHAGIALSATKKQMVYSRLGRRLRALGLDSFRDYLALLRQGDSDEWQAFTNALTTNLTAFFREEHHFPVLTELMKEQQDSSLRLWCCAASTGEEPYSMAITAAETFGTLTPPVRILATDVDTNVLATAEAGVYAMSRVEKMNPALLHKYFRRGRGEMADQVRVRDELRALISFRPLNLLDARYPMRGPFHAIFCRNVMIYFDKPTQRTVLEKFRPLMHPRGLLFAGHSESFHNAADLFRLRGKTVYEPAEKIKAAA